MYDICLCAGENCPLKQDCFRYTAPILGRQDFFGAPPYQHNACEYFLPNIFQIQYAAYLLWEVEGCQEDKSEIYWFAAKAQILRKAGLLS
jgi:hypothetical protein